MHDLVVLFLHLIVTIDRLAGPGGARLSGGCGRSVGYLRTDYSSLVAQRSLIFPSVVCDQYYNSAGFETIETNSNLRGYELITKGIHWGRTLLAAFFAELAIFAVFIPVLLRYGEQPARYTVPPLALVMSFLFSLWVGKRIESRFVLHGVLVGIFATLMYVALTFAQPEPFIYIVAHALKILGGAAGGHVAGKRWQIIQAKTA